MVKIFLNYNWGGTEREHQVTTHLCELIDVESIGATVVGREPYEYIKQQTDIDYDPLYCIQDVHNEIIQQSYQTDRIDDLEQRFGVPHLWPAIWADRKYIHYGSEKQKRLIQGWFDFYLDVFETFQPDIYLTPSVDSAYTWIPFRIVTEEYGIAAQKGHTRILDNEALQKTVYDDFEAIWSRYESIKSHGEPEEQYPQSYQNAVNFLDEFRSSGLVPGYTSDTTTSTSDQSVVREALNYWYEKNFGHYKKDFYHDSTRERIKISLKRLFRKRRVTQLDLFRDPNYDEKYVFFPLHLQPEASTMVKSPMYMHLPDVIRNISKSLPVNHKLYVKEHPSLLEYKVRPIRYYNEIDDLPNTELIDPNADSHALIKNAEAVSTVTGTAGLEGVLYKKPVITFGNPHYDKLPQVYSTDSPEELGLILSRALTDHTHTQDYENELLHYLTAIFEESYPTPQGKTGAKLQDVIDRQCEILKEDLIYQIN